MIAGHTAAERLRSRVRAAARPPLHRPVVLTLLLSALAFFTAAPAALAAATTWTQSDWSGGDGAPTWSPTATFDSSSDVLSSAPGQLTLGQTAQHGDGDGDDGAVTISGSVNLSTENLTAGRTCADGGDAVDYALADNAAAGSSSLTLGQAPGAGCLQVGDEVLIIVVQGGDANDVSGVGAYETGSIDAISGATLTLRSPLANSYTTVDGTGHPEAVMVQRVPNYTDVTIDPSAKLTTSAFGGSTGGALFLRATGTVSINGTIEADGLGYSGGQATPPSDSDVPASTGAGSAPALDQNASNDQGGGGGSSNATGANDSTGGGGGANGGAGGDGADAGVGGPNDVGSGGTPSASSLTTLLPGGGGGAGGGADTGCSPSGDTLPGGPAGDGGGIIVISANQIVDDGTISADGTDGAQRPLDPSDPDPDDSLCGGGGGGGAGGSVFLSAISDVNLAGGTVTASGGNGGDGVQWGGAGGAGGGGSVLLSSGSTTELGADAVTALGGQPGTPVTDGASAGSASSGAVELWEPTSATHSGTSDPAVSVQPLTGYEPRGELTSSIFDSGMAAGAVWDTVADTATTPAGTSVSARVRTGQDADMSDAPSFGSCPALSSGAPLSGDSCVTEGDRYAQYQVELIGGGDTPTLTGVSITYQPTTAVDTVTVGAPSGVASPNPTSAPSTPVLAPSTSTPIITPPTVAPAGSPGYPKPAGGLAGRTLGRVRLGMTRAQSRRAYTDSSSHGKRYEEFFSEAGGQVRVGYPSPRLLKTLSFSKRHSLHGGVVLALTANPYYALRGICPGARLQTAVQTLHTGAVFHVGLNNWYMAPDGVSTAVLKVRHGIVEEIGIADATLTHTRLAQRTFITSFS